MVVKRRVREGNFPLPCVEVDLVNCSLEETGKWEWPLSVEESLRVLEIFQKEASGTPEEWEEQYQRDLAYMRHAKERVDLHGVRIGDEGWGFCQFIFDFASDGRMVSIELENEEDYQATNKRVPCRSFGFDGEWRAYGHGRDVLSRFLALCKARYGIPFKVIAGVCYWDHHCHTYYEDEDQRRKIQAMTEDEFYEEYVKGQDIIWH